MVAQESVISLKGILDASTFVLCKGGIMGEPRKEVFVCIRFEKRAGINGYAQRTPQIESLFEDHKEFISPTLFLNEKGGVFNVRLSDFPYRHEFSYYIPKKEVCGFVDNLGLPLQYTALWGDYFKDYKAELELCGIKASIKKFYQLAKYVNNCEEKDLEQWYEFLWLTYLDQIFKADPVLFKTVSHFVKNYTPAFKGEVEESKEVKFVEFYVRYGGNVAWRHADIQFTVKVGDSSILLDREAIKSNW